MEQTDDKLKAEWCLEEEGTDKWLLILPLVAGTRKGHVIADVERLGSGRFCWHIALPEFVGPILYSTEPTREHAFTTVEHAILPYMEDIREFYRKNGQS